MSFKSKFGALAGASAIAAGTLIAGSAGVDADTAGPNEPTAGTDVTADSTTLLRAMSVNASGGTRIELSTHGNMYAFESPFGYEHINVGGVHEGYVVCYDTPAGTQVAYDTGSDESGFAAPTTANSSPTTANIIRTTTDGVIQLQQRFTFRGGERRMIILNSVKNVSGGPITNVRFRRIYDPDVDVAGTDAFADFGDNWHAVSDQGVLTWNDPANAPAGAEAHAMILRAWKGGTDRFAETGSLPTSCPIGVGASAPAQTDVFVSANFDLGDFTNNQTKAVKVDYYRT